MSSKFKFLAGSIALEDKPHHLKVAEIVRNSYADCEGYVAYKLTTLGRASDDDVPSFIIITKEHGIILLDVVESEISEVKARDGAEYWQFKNGELVLARNLVIDIYQDEVSSRLKNDLTLYNRKLRKAKTPIHCATVFCFNKKEDITTFYDEDEFGISALDIEGIEKWLTEVPKEYNCSDEEMGKIYSLIEGTFIYENKNVGLEESPLEKMDDYIQRSLKTTFKQDDSQRFASMQLPPGPQRIRGLAGTGKTIVLALKAAITHKRLENAKILYLFNTQSLYQHVQGLISKYYTLEAKKAPDFENRLNVLHAWGGRQKPGLYYNLCQEYGLSPLTLGDVRGRGDALQYIYKDFLKKVGDVIVPKYDLILIDEAQDFPNEVFEVVYKLAKGNGAEKRIIWAYDEFQSLKDTAIKEPEDLFGKNKDGEPNMPNSVLAGEYAGSVPKDFVLPNCYRTPRPVLMTAHGVAMGLYTDNPVEMFYYDKEWEAIGYRVNNPASLRIERGDEVEIERPDENSKNLLETLLRENKKNPHNLVQTSTCQDSNHQIAFVQDKIGQLIIDEGVPPEEIIIVNLATGNNKSYMLEIQHALNSISVKSVIPGYIESADIFKPKGYVTITTPFRAKGNEANVVFVLNAHKVKNDYTSRMRNAFFVAVTRSRGWCYISGIGTQMEAVSREITAIKSSFPKFKFTCPDPAIIKQNKSFLNKSNKELDEIQGVLDLIDKNPELREVILGRFKQG